MSNLRDIMQRLGARADYDRHPTACNAAMLHDVWT
jgi:hypothetical protein